MDTRKELLKAVESEHPLNKEPILTIPELLDLIQKLPHSEGEMDEKNDEFLKNIFATAVSNGHKEIVEALLDRKLDPNNVLNTNGARVLNSAAYRGHVEIAKLLIAAKADVNSICKTVSGDEQTPLFASVVGKNKEMVQLLLDAKADPNKGKVWHTAVGFAMMTHQYDITVMLTKAGAVPKSSEFSGLMQDFSDLYSNLREGRTHEEVEKLLPAVNAWLNKGVSLDGFISLHRFLRFCDQKNPIVKDSLMKLCELIPNHVFEDEYGEVTVKEHVLKPAKEYIKKLQVVMEYKPEKEPDSPWLAFSGQDRIAWTRKYGYRFDANTVEELYENIREKRHPYLSFFGLAPAVQPEPERKMTLSQRTS